MVVALLLLSFVSPKVAVVTVTNLSVVTNEREMPFVFAEFCF